MQPRWELYLIDSVCVSVKEHVMNYVLDPRNKSEDDSDGGGEELGWRDLYFSSTHHRHRERSVAIQLYFWKSRA